MQPGYRSGSEPTWWWKVAMHLDEAQLALSNAMAHNVDDPRSAHALYDRLREGQAILLEIFRAKGLLPGSTNGKIEVPMPQSPTAPVPSSDEPAPATDADAQPLAASEPAVSEADHAAADVESPQPAAPSPEPAAPDAIQTEPPPPAPPSTDPSAGTGG